MSLRKSWSRAWAAHTGGFGRRKCSILCRPNIVHIVIAARFALPACAPVPPHKCERLRGKPFALTTREAMEIPISRIEGPARVRAAHRAPFQRAGQLYQTFLPMIGDPIHVESYFPLAGPPPA